MGGRWAVSLALLAICPSAGGSSSFRGDVLAQARRRIEEPTEFEPSKEEDGVSFRISKVDKSCGGDGVPITFVEYKVANARPVDVFNVLADASTQPRWDTSGVLRVSPLGDFRHKQARAFAALFSAKPLGDRKVYEWQVIAANVSSEVFWVVFTTLDNEDLLQREPLDRGAVRIDSCLTAYKISRGEDGITFVQNSQQVNSHPFPLSSRTVASLAMPATVTFARGLRAQSQQQASAGWESNRTVVPDWMLKDATCLAPKPDTALKDSLLSRASLELARAGSSRGVALPSGRISTGEEVHLWRRDRVSCAGVDVPLFRAEFALTGVLPSEAFQVLVAKAREPRWNANLARARLIGEPHSGVRGVQERFLDPVKIPFLSSARELWEFQAAERSENGTYSVVLTSMSSPSTPGFDKADVEAQQCLAAYELGPRLGGGTMVRMTSHVNPEVWAILRSLGRLWNGVYESMMKEFAEAFSVEANMFVKQRQQGGMLLDDVDGGALWLLAPNVLACNATVTIEDVLACPVGERIFLENFAVLCVASALNTSRWNASFFAARARSVQNLFSRLSWNATAAENATMGSAAADAADVQRQGLVLAALQSRVRLALAADACGGHDGLPDIDRDSSGAGMPLWLAGLLALLAVLAVVCLCIGGCGLARCLRRRRRDAAARAAAVVLLSVEPGVAVADGQS